MTLFVQLEKGHEQFLITNTQGEGLPEKCGGSACPAFQNLYPIFDRNL